MGTGVVPDANGKRFAMTKHSRIVLVHVRDIPLDRGASTMNSDDPMPIVYLVRIGMFLELSLSLSLSWLSRYIMFLLARAGRYIYICI